MRRLIALFSWMLIFVPIAIYFHYAGYPGTWVFFASILAIVPLSKFLGKATEQIAMHSTPMMAGLLNATPGNLIELVVSIFALYHGLIELVKASILGSIIYNILLLIGLSIFIGGIKHVEQKFDSVSASISTTMLLIAVTGLTMPTIYSFATGKNAQPVSDLVSIVLALTYICGLIFALVTHNRFYDVIDNYVLEKIEPEWPKRTAALVLVVCSGFATWIASLLVNSVEPAMAGLNISQTFIGIVIIAILSNIAETASAITMAIKNKVNIAIEIGTSSAIQIALFVVPILVLLSGFFVTRFSLVFTMFEIVSVIFGVLILNFLVADGRCNWLEGIQLMAVYFIIAISFYFV